MTNVMHDVYVSPDDFAHARECALQTLHSLDGLLIRVSAKVDLDEVLHLAGVNELLEALESHPPAEPSIRAETVEACFAAVSAGETSTARALLPRVFERVAHVEAAASGIHAGLSRRRAA